MDTEAAQNDGSFRRKMKPIAAMLLCMLLMPNVANASEDSVHLTVAQRSDLFHEANRIFLAADSSTSTNPEADYERAAAKYQLILDSGFQSPELLLNLGLAELKAGNIGKSRLFLERAAKFAPSNSAIAQAKRLATPKPIRTERTPAQVIEIVYMSIVQFVGEPIIWWAFPMAAGLFWAVLIVRSLGFKLVPGWVLIPTLILAMVAGSFCYAGQIVAANRASLGFVIADSVELRDGDGSQFQILVELADADGLPVSVLNSRGDWTKVAIDNLTGWLPNSSVEKVHSEPTIR